MPAKRFFLYAAAFTGAVLFYYFYIGWFSKFLIITMVILPAVSILASLPGMISARVNLSSPAFSSTGKSIDFKISVDTKGSMPFGKTRIHYSVYNIFTGDKYSHSKIKIKSPGAPTAVTVEGTDKCGCIAMDIKKIWVYDFLGIIWLPKKVPVNTMTAVLPQYIESGLEESSPPEETGRLVPKRGGGFSEEYELREYQPGDSVASIHWKLTSKLGKPIIKEAMIPETGEIFITIAPEISPQESADSLYKACCQLISRGMGHTLCWMAPHQPEMHFVESRRDLDRGMYALLSTPACDITPMSITPGTGFLVSGGEVKHL